MTETTSCIDKIASAVRKCDVRSITCVPGYPVTELAELLITEADAKWCINEKVALEIALGASASGIRSMAIVKHVGMNLLSDPLITASTHRIGAGVVIIAGDDPMAVASQNEQDSRYWGLIAEVPVLDPNPINLHDAIFEAYRISEIVSTPVIVRATDHVLRSGYVGRGKAQTLNLPEPFDRAIWEYSMHGRHQLFHRDTYPLIEDMSERSRLNQYHEGGRSGGGQVCIISSGYSSMIVTSIMRRKGIEMPHISLSFVSPLPVKRITEFTCDRRVLVVEETEPVIEGQLGTGTYKILGRRSGHLPYGGLTEDDILFAIENMDKNEIVLDTTPETLKNRGYSLDICDDCPFIPVYEAVRAVKKSSGMKLMIAGDMGCSIRTAPTGVVDVAYALGGAIGVASGMPAKSVAIIGDFGLVHSGLQALIDAEFNQRDVLVIVLANRVSAMTGGQKVPDPERIIRACCSDVAVIDETAGGQTIEQLLRERLSAKGVSVIVALGACRKDPGVL
ncbi:MAG: indolepyruvate ferredoxin oxidoreductase [Candidatus Methanogaster sp.]|uniref:Indolepyruvate ferredoxin oxidoreductase n=1 Tax=Candidatus Methanogaster sp. TaxID=3386292 RepID=A0AC61L344_9EURY|nr:MAG: indolepyruvate ferredoxin oxidoreductase [ANME-2 cluster archaeon]